MALFGGTQKAELITRGCGCLLLLLFCGCCFGTIFIIINRPQAIWSRVAEFLNDGAIFETATSSKTSSDVENEIAAQVKNVGENDVYISEEDLNVLLKNQVAQFKDLNVDLEDGEARVFWEMDNSETPILGEAVLAIDGQNRLVITEFGTPRMFFPEFAYPAINNLAQQVLDQDIVKKQLTILNLDNNLEIREVKILKDTVFLRVIVNVKIFPT